MPDLSTILAGFGDVWTLSNFIYIIAGVAIGQIVGATPGLSTSMALAIAVPLTYGMDTLTAIAFLISVNKGGTVGGAVPAILINTPGTPEAAATALDGHPMAKSGRPLKAMRYSLYYSVFGDVSSDIVLITVAAPLALVALKMGPVEITALMILAFTVITALVGNSMTKGLIAASLGFLLASIGLDPGQGTPRFTFGMLELYDGIPLSVVSIGVLAVGEIINQIGVTRGGVPSEATISMKHVGGAENRVTLSDLLAHKAVAFRAFVIGTIVGAIPGIGSATAGMLSYSLNKRAAKDPEAFGTGDPRGIAASEAANSAVVGANLIPLLTLGIPGNIAAALLVSGFIIHGVQPGPLLFEQQGRLIYGLFGAMLVANVCNLGVGQFGMRLWAFAISAPRSVIFPAALLLCITGTYIASGGFFGVFLMLIFAALGVVMRAMGLSLIAFLIAFVLTPTLESALTSAMLITRGDIWRILDHPVAILLLILTVLAIVFLNFGPRKPARQSTVGTE